MYFMTEGYGCSEYALNAFDNALMNAGIGDYNLIKLSSVLPPNCKKADFVNLPAGSFLHTAYACHIEASIGNRISAAIAIAIPRDSSLPGIIMESAGQKKECEVIKEACEMARNAMNARSISDFDIHKTSISVITKAGINCLIAVVAIWQEDC